MMEILFASDHAGRALKDHLFRYASQTEAWTVRDLGPGPDEAVDYPDYAHSLATALKEGVGANGPTFGVLICGTGIGMSMVANRHEHVRAALCYNEYAARMARQHNNANVLCLGGRVIGTSLAEAIVDAFMTASFEGGRHERRIAKFGITTVPTKTPAQ